MIDTAVNVQASLYTSVCYTFYSLTEAMWKFEGTKI